jgi:hypothetical protein
VFPGLFAFLPPGDFAGRIPDRQEVAVTAPRKRRGLILVAVNRLNNFDLGTTGLIA